LAKAGIGCVCLRDGSGAQQALSSGAFDLIIVNASERDDGVNVAARLADGIPILALAAEDASELPTFADAIVTMPIAPRHLARTALDLIEQTSPRATPRKTERTRSAAAREIPKLEPEPLDARALGDLDKLGGSDFVRDIVAQFVADAASVLAGLTAAVAARDSRAFREQAHALRSCAANVGAQNVYRMCLAWRDLDAQEIATSGAQYMTMLEAEFERVRGALAPMLQSGGGSGPSSAAA
jgi:two-component system sensor histidine kinase RpfC